MCQIDVDSDFPPAFVSYKVVKARKTHKCHECRCAIPIGEKYERTTGKWEGEFNTYRTCLACVEIRNKFFQCWEYGGVWERMDECVLCDSITMADIDGLSPLAIGKLEEMIGDKWEEMNAEDEE